MEIAKFFTREESVAGLEITDERISLILLEYNKKGDKISPNFYVQETLEEATISNGIIKNKGLFLKALKNLTNPLKIKIRYAVVSIPLNQIYFKIFSFPKSLGEAKLEEAVKLNAGFPMRAKQ